MSLSIEVAVTSGTATSEKGRLIEDVGREILEALNYDVIEEIRLTGMEVDLLAQHRVSSEKVFVECKAYRDALPADIISKLLGNVVLKGASSGWLFSTGPLGKEAKGIMNEWEQNLPQQRRMLQVYTPERLIDLLVRSGTVCNPDKIRFPHTYHFSEDLCLLITNLGRFWIAQLVDVSAGISYAVMPFDAGTGEPICDESLIGELSKLDTIFSGLDWLMATGNEDLQSASDVVREEFQSIVQVSSGDQWADYRPSRPQDFVGREKLINEIFEFLESVRSHNSTTRLMALKAPSGWGKSSMLLKLIDKSRNIRNKKKFFMFAVDVRAATSRRYAEYALMSCLNTAIDAGFVRHPKKPISISFASDPFSDSGVQELLQCLRDEEKLIILFFDQFEEIFSKKELAPLFDNIRMLCHAIDASQENLLIGFSWKTDGTIPADHPAYYMWHSLSDRRREWSLSPFQSKDISKALLIFSKEVQSPLHPVLRRHLSDNCQGYPWLLKKLCIHVYSLMQQGIDQLEMLGRSLNVQELFEKDLSELSQAESACVRSIAQDSPADFFKIVDLYGGDVLQSLIHRRIVLRRGDRVMLYWDIFRDYVLTRTVPQFSVSYIPQSTFHRYYDSLEVIYAKPQIRIGELAKVLGVGLDAAENRVRDLVMLGNIERQGDKLLPIQVSESEAEQKIIDFFRNHYFIKFLVEKHGPGFSITESEFLNDFRKAYENAPLADKTFVIYANRMLSWAYAIGLVEVRGTIIVHTNKVKLELQSRIPRKRRFRRNANFLGDAPADIVLEAVRHINNGVTSEEELNRKGYRNALSVLWSLDALSRDDENVHIIIPAESIEKWLVDAVWRTDTMQLVAKYMSEQKFISDAPKVYLAKDIGALIGSMLGRKWSDASMIRYGGGLLRWYEWVRQIQYNANMYPRDLLGIND